jgi:CO/xanthine dehydrogenase FAD-binding subunit
MLDLSALLRPTSPEEAIRLFAETPGNGLYVSGGTVIVPSGSPNLDFLVDLSAAGLDYVRPLADNASTGTAGEGPGLALGAGTCICDLARSQQVADLAGGVLHEAAAAVANHTVRNRATLGGNVVASHYPTDLPPALLVLEASILAMNLDGKREIDLETFYTDRRTQHKKGDLIVEVRVPGASRNLTAAFEKLGRLKLDIATVNAAAAVRVEGGGVVHARAAVSGTGRPPARLHDVETFLIGQKADRETFEEAGRIASESVDPRSNHRASGEYRKKMIGVLVRRALERAAEK